MSRVRELTTGFTTNPNPYAVSGVAFSPDGETLAVVGGPSNKGKVELWNPSTPEERESNRDANLRRLNEARPAIYGISEAKAGGLECNSQTARSGFKN